MIRGQPADWLKKNDSHYLADISHLEVGLCHQSLRMEFENPKASYNLLIRNQSCCDQFLQTLTCKSRAVVGAGRGEDMKDLLLDSYQASCSWMYVGNSLPASSEKSCAGNPTGIITFSASL